MMNTDSRSKDVFFGREEIFQTLDKRLHAFIKGYRQNIGIVGNFSCGKTSLLRVFRSRILSEQLIPIVFTCRPSESFEWFGERWIGEMLLGFHQALLNARPASFQDLVQPLKPLIPKTLRAMKNAKKLMMVKRYDQAWRELLGLSRILQEESGRKILLILDDLDLIRDFELSDPYGALGKEIMVQKETMYMVSIASPRKAHYIFHEKLALLFGNFETLTLGPLDCDEALQWIDRKTGHALAEPLKRALIQLTDGRPYYLDLLLNRIESLGRDFLNAETLFTEALTCELFDSDGHLYQYFMRRLHSVFGGSRAYRAGDVLLAIAEGHRKLTQMARFLKLKQQEIKKYLESLLQAEIIEKHGLLFLIPDPLFRFWLTAVYRELRSSIESDDPSGRGEFQRRIETLVSERVRRDALELPKRLEMLFRKFANEAVTLNGKRFHCPQFHEILSRPNNGRVFPVLARSGKERWLCQVLSGKVTEEDVRLFLEDVRGVRSPVQKRVIIGLRGIDLNAKLLAQEAKILYLDRKDLNDLLDMYNQPKVLLGEETAPLIHG